MATVAYTPEVFALREALELIGKGWTQGAYWRSETGRTDCRPQGARRMDLAHALELAGRKHGCDSEELRGLVLAELDEPYRSDYAYGLERWNDADFREKGDVLMLLRRVLERQP